MLSTLVTTDGSEKRELLVEKTNWFWHDSAYSLAKNCKWLDNSSFGLCKGENNCYFSTEKKQNS
jgi:hypothetical protein